MSDWCPPPWRSPPAVENKWVIAWFVVTGIEIVVLEVLVETGVELKGGSRRPA